ncbi:MAG: LysR family transcriptional regulator [Verrucomicrobia bacterium]|nr:LysR family transcriptional regulator [Verrucomicrobiota bacterium]
MTGLLRAFFVVVEEGSLNRASARLHLSQPALSRQMQSLEHQLGGPLLERLSSGVKPTALGQETLARLQPLLAQVDGALAELRRIARGQREELRIGYLGSAAQLYLNPALVCLRRTHPEARVKLLDLTPGEQLAALREGRLDLALIGQEGAGPARDFYTRRLATLGCCVALAGDHPLARRRQLRLTDLATEAFLSAPEAHVPGRNRWVAQLCRRAGFRPRFVAEGDSIGESFSLVASEGAVLVLPDYFAETPPPGVKLLPLSDDAARWDLLLLWQRGRPSAVLKAMIELLTENARTRQAAAELSPRGKARPGGARK